MPPYRHQITYQSITGLPEDRFVNTLHSSSVDDVAAGAFAQAIVTAFGTVLPGQTHGLTEYLGPAVSRVAQAGHVLVYDLADPEPRSPVWDEPFTVLTTVGSAVQEPREVCICLSFQGDPVSGEPQARKRGRMFFGPLCAIATQLDAPTGDVMPSDEFLEDAVLALTELRDTTTDDWVVYSPTGDTVSVITNGWIDDALDTQRRRGQAPASRTLWS